MALKNDCFALPAGVEWTPVADALARLRDSLEPVTGAETVPLAQAAGRILAADAVAQVSAPPLANAAVDGYALAHASLTAEGRQRLHLLDGRAAAGVPFEGSVPPGCAVRVLTGAVMPDGTDSVVMDEDIELKNGAITFGSGLRAGANRRRAGENVTAGGIALTAGSWLGPQHVAQAASAGLGELTVRKHLRVTLLATGDELALPGESLAPGMIPDSNSPMLAALIAAQGADCLAVTRLPDDAKAVAAGLRQAAEQSDAVIATGGASAGDEDHVAREMKHIGAMTEWRIAMKPGRPLALGQIGRVPVFGLPGNPVAAFVCFLLFVRPALRVLAGGDWTEPGRFPLRADFSARKKPGRTEYLRARANPDGTVSKFDSDGSGLIRGLCWSDGLVMLEMDRGAVSPGETVDFIPYSSFGLAG